MDGRGAQARADELVGDLAAAVEDLTPVAPGGYEARVPQDREVLGDAAGGHPEALREVGGRARRVEVGEQVRAAAPDHLGERAAGRRGRLPQQADPARRVDQGRLPRLLGDRRGPVAGEGARDQHQPAPVERQAAVALHPDLEPAVDPADVRVQIAEQPLDPALAQQPGPVHQVRLEQRPDPRPVGLDRPMPELLQRLRQSAERAERVVAIRTQALGRVAAAVQGLDVGGDLLLGGRAHQLDLVLEGGERRRGRRSQEVGDVSAARQHGVGEGQVELGDQRAHPLDPREVERDQRRVSQRPDRRGGLPHRRDRKPGPDQVVEREVVADHLAQSKSLDGLTDPREARIRHRPTEKGARCTARHSPTCTPTTPR